MPLQLDAHSVSSYGKEVANVCGACEFSFHRGLCEMHQSLHTCTFRISSVLCSGATSFCFLQLKVKAVLTQKLCVPVELPLAFVLGLFREL